ncbi:Hypothetical Protein RradSPS_0099 [Rubrobacter radiotolerans]|uniref:Uncharacterized protein n=1 Tax=Rubrobacter radiotolerans TaxID=42256 RepID=A0A023WYS5_RUBRA|nr:hypothetical protein [Rubrobacter radiotolerans]AHY45382.1 Hypothetical Protein RradSPS_0099 [Rubrobacter radiotolerans]MDX5892793.1 hypothetical protein [Rubrobacter radiotolerans]SMC02507.1 conserved hypothetical protein [Rubrobacter radiotolerans DSM 5868]
MLSFSGFFRLSGFVSTLGRRAAPAFAISLALLVVGCGGGIQESPDEDGQQGGATVAAPAEGEGVAAFSGLEAAGEEATGWQEDAELYAVASATPSLDSEGNSPSWLYTYVSESAGAVASVVYEGDQARIDPAQELPEADINYILENTLPPPEELLDSGEAVEDAQDVLSALEEEPGVAASAGLDSFSGEGPEWIFSTTRGEERVEDRVPAVR